MSDETTTTDGLAEGEILDDTVTLTELGEVTILNNGAPLRLDLGKATDSEAGLRAYDDETIRIVDERNEEAYGLLGIYEALKDDASKAKKAWENAVDELQKLIRERREERGKPQLPGLYESLDYVDEGIGSGDLVARQQVTKEDDAWKSVKLVDMAKHDGLPANVASILIENGLDTLGAVTDYTNPNASGWCNSLTDFKSFGPKKLEAWQDACANFWKRWPNERRARSQDLVDGVDGGRGEPGSDRESDVDGDGN